MPNSHVESPADTMVLSMNPSAKDVPGFERNAETHTGSSYARTLASAYMRFTHEGRSLTELDSPNSLMALAGLHQDLTDDARRFLQADVPFVQEDEPLDALLTQFAIFRMSDTAKRLHDAVRQEQSATITSDLQRVLQARHAELGATLGA